MVSERRSSHTASINSAKKKKKKVCSQSFTCTSLDESERMLYFQRQSEKDLYSSPSKHSPLISPGRLCQRDIGCTTGILRVSSLGHMLLSNLGHRSPCSVLRDLLFHKWTHGDAWRPLGWCLHKNSHWLSRMFTYNFILSNVHAVWSWK